LSEDFIEKVSRIIAGYLTGKEFQQFINLLKEEMGKNFFTYHSESNLLRIINSAYNPVTFINECIKYPVYIFYLVKISANSNYLTDIIVSSPGLFYLLSNSAFLESRLNEEEFSSDVRRTVSLHKDFQSKINSLRVIKKREMLRIAVRDLHNSAALQDTAQQLSLLSEVLLAELFQLCYTETLQNNNIRKASAEYCLISLGKLGGRELNYSSDVDIIVFYQSAARQSKTDFQEILVQVVRLFIQSAGSNTGKGFLYRIDLRLRPYGKSSSICGNINDYLNYYEARGEDWERQMLIKMDYLCGSPALFEKFSGYLQPFIYPRALSEGPLKTIAKMKTAIEKHNKNERDIKNSSGGIRDIEFSVQALQLLNGGFIKELRTGNTLKAIEYLNEYKLLTDAEAGILADTYIFYRKIEHFLQLMNNTQTHTIPENGEILDLLSSFMGYPNSAKFIKAVNDSRKDIRAIFNSITGINKISTFDEQIEKINFRHPDRFIKDLEYLEKGIGLLGNKQFDSEMINSFQAVKPYFIKYLQTSPRPDVTVTNFARLIRNAKLPSIWYKAFSDFEFFKKILTICTYSQAAIDLCSEDRDLRDFLFTKKVFEPASRLAAHNISTKKFLFVLAVQLSLKLIKPETFCRLLSLFIYRKIEKTVGLYKDDIDCSNFTVAAMGSLGNKEITFFSDLDLLFISNSAFYDQSQVFFTDVLADIKRELSPFAIDCRLRPEGKSSQLSWNDAEYIKYIKTRAAVWEFQSLCKISFICGNKNIFDTIKKSAEIRISGFDAGFVKDEIAKMRKKMFGPSFKTGAEFELKHSAGGILDIDFFAQYLMLAGGRFSALTGLSHYNIMLALSKDKKNRSKFEILTSNYLSLKYINLYFQNIFNKKCKLDTNDTLTAVMMQKYTGIEGGIFYDKIKKMLSDNVLLLTELT
jgi:glutamate-ammonia-ligase adenylyltransferase